MLEAMLFGHEKGAFTGATQSRSGYFEVADGGTIFLDEVGELPLTTQVRLLRVLENGEFIKVGSSKVQKTNVRIVAATNLNMQKAIRKNKFREDLYYRLSTIEINIPPLRNRKDDIHLLFRKFSSDFAQRYSMPSIKLEDDAIKTLINYRWDGNIRQLKNIAEQLSVLEEDRSISNKTLKNYLPKGADSSLPAIISGKENSNDFNSEREILYKVLFDMKGDLNDLKKLTMELMESSNISEFKENNEHLIKKIYDSRGEKKISDDQIQVVPITEQSNNNEQKSEFDYVEEINAESLSLHDKELELIKKSLEKHKGRRKLAAKELGISERTLYRKIKQFNL